MPAHPFYTNFTTGTVTEKLDSRVDFAKYQNSARVIRNGIVLPQGGVASRAGTIFLGRAKFNDKRCRLVTFQFSVAQSYVVEFGEGYARFWTQRGPVVDAGGNVVEVATPYTEADLRELRFEQSADVMYVGHPDYPPAKITRITTTEFRYSEINFFPYPTYEPRVAPQASLTLSQVSPGVATATASAAAFLSGDVGRQIWNEAGRAVITAVASNIQATVRILDAFDAPTAAQGEWTMDGSANAGTLTPSVAAPRWASTTLTSSVGAFRSTDVGKYVYVHDGIAQITSVTSSEVAQAQILRDLGATSAAAAGSWTVESVAWSDALGYPGVPCLFQGRLWWAGSPSFQDYIWASRTSDYENHARGALASDALVFQLATPGVNLIRWMKPNSVRGLALGTIAGEITLDGGTEQAISPENVPQMIERTKYGSDFTVDALKVDNQHIFIQRGGTRVRELAYKFSEDTFASPDISILAEHLFREAVVETTYVSTPESLIVALRDDGVLNFCTYEREQNVVAWSYVEASEDDLFESVTALPNACGTGDELWAATKRACLTGAYWATNYWATDYWASDYWGGGGTVDARYIEVFDGQMNTDAGLVWSGAAANTFTGLAHLEGRVVRVVIDDGTEYNLTVVGGVITLPGGVTTTSIEIGLPWVMTLVTVRPDLQIPNGTIQGRRKRWNEVTVRVYCTRGAILLNGEAMDYPGEEENGPETALDPFSGDMRKKTDFGWSRDAFITIQRTEAKPCTITGITGGLAVADD